MISTSIVSSISKSISFNINNASGDEFDPLSLFASGEQGVWYDPSDMSTLFQDAAGSLPVTSAGQPVGRMLDKSGRGNHATQATATSRPVLQTEGGRWYLSFDGVDDGLATAATNFTATDKMTVWSGLAKLSDVSVAVVCELSTNFGASNGSFGLFAPINATAPNYGFGSRGTIGASISRSSFAAPNKAVLTATSDISAPSVAIRVNTTTAAPVVATQGTGNYGSHQLYIGRRAGTSSPFNGNMYGLIVRGATSSAQQIIDTETYINGKTGAY